MSAESGVGSTQCSETYPGDQAFSEIESRNLRDFYLTLDPLPVVSNCIHSAAELWLYPFGYKHNEFPSNVDEMVSVKHFRNFQ